MEQAILWMYAGFAVLFGLSFGSFLNVLIARWPQDASLLTPSHCPRCGHTIRWVDLVPVLSWMWLRGRCRDCDAPIPITYPLVELLGGLLGWLVYQRIFNSIEDLDAAHVTAWVVYFGFACLIVVMMVVDLRYQIIPDQTSSYAVPFGIAGIVALQLLGFPGFDGMPAVSWEQSVLGAVVGGASLGAIALVWRWIAKEEALGFGDAKILAMIGAFLGAVPGVFMVLFFASIGSIGVHLVVLAATRRRSALPFGPPLGLAALVYLFYGDVFVPLFLPGLAEYMGIG